MRLEVEIRNRGEVIPSKQGVSLLRLSETEPSWELAALCHRPRGLESLKLLIWQ